MMKPAQIPAGSLPKPWVIGPREEAEAPSSPRPARSRASGGGENISQLGQELATTWRPSEPRGSWWTAFVRGLPKNTHEEQRPGLADIILRRPSVLGRRRGHLLGEPGWRPPWVKQGHGAFLGRDAETFYCSRPWSEAMASVNAEAMSKRKVKTAPARVATGVTFRSAWLKVSQLPSEDELELSREQYSVSFLDLHIQCRDQLLEEVYASVGSAESSSVDLLVVGIKFQLEETSSPSVRLTHRKTHSGWRTPVDHCC